VHFSSRIDTAVGVGYSNHINIGATLQDYYHKQMCEVVCLLTLTGTTSF